MGGIGMAQDVGSDYPFEAGPGGRALNASLHAVHQYVVPNPISSAWIVAMIL
jgi:hypothetical protein